jgi:phosphoglycerol transferase MdoB-like AlkP superfamily enzyme
MAGRASGPPPASASAYLALAPALLAGVLCLRAWALWLELPTQPVSASVGLIGAALLQELLAFGRSLPLLFLLSWPLLRLRNGRLRHATLGLLWATWLAMQVALEQYFLAARVPLGADLFGYAWQEITTTADGGVRTDAAALLGWLLPLAVLGLALIHCVRRPLQWRRAVAVAVLIACVGLWFVPLRFAAAGSEDARNLARNKAAYFVADSLRYWTAGGSGSIAGSADQLPAHPDHPFVHRERTPDVLGPHFVDDPAPPNLVFIIVEGLGRTFSGPGAVRGSFTPFLDELAGRSLYWDNFLATQGRTFGVLPSVFGSLPFGEKGFAALGERMPPHAGLLNVLQRQGYGVRFYYGSDARFDNERAYLRRQGVTRIVDSTGFGAAYRRNPYSSWGYDDNELVSRVLADGAILDDAILDSASDAVAAAPPTVTIVQTMTMHTSYRFPGQDAYRRRFEQRLDALRVDEAHKAGYRTFGNVYSAVLFTDDALRRYFEAAARAPGYDNTIFVITGDHRLPEIPMETGIERYHVPLIVFSPRLKQPARIRAVSSHLDITPSLLAFLAHRHGLQRPAAVAWTGTGLDTGVAFRNDHDIPLKQAKTILADFVSGPWFISHDQLYRLHDGMRLEAVEDDAAKQRVLGRFQRYQRDNAHFASTLQLSPEGDAPRLAAFVDSAPGPADARGNTRAREPARRTLYVHDLQAPEGADDVLALSARFTNGSMRGEPFVPLLVLSDESGREVREAYAASLQLRTGESGEAHFSVDLDGLATGHYFVAVLPSHPDTGKRVGEGIYRVPMKIRCCAPGGGARARP